MYLFKTRAGGLMFEAKVKANSDEEAQQTYVKAIKAGNYKVKKEDVCSPKLCITTYEEIEDGDTIPVTSSEEDGIRK